MHNMSDYDPVNKPMHYALSGIECIEYIKERLTPEEFKGYCHGNLIKYQHRHNYKGKPVEDMEKARYYLEKMLETMRDMHK